MLSSRIVMTSSWVRVGDVCILCDSYSVMHFPVKIRIKIVNHKKKFCKSLFMYLQCHNTAGMVVGRHETKDCKLHKCIFFECKQCVEQSELSDLQQFTCKARILTCSALLEGQ